MVLDLANILVQNTIAVPTAHRMVMNHAGTKLLVFSDGYAPAACGGTSRALTVFDLTSSATSPAVTTVCGFNEAVWGVFSTDDTKAYIMNCGPECGVTGTTASVTLLDMTSTPPNPLSNTPFNTGTGAGATVGFLERHYPLCGRHHRRRTRSRHAYHLECEFRPARLRPGPRSDQRWLSHPDGAGSQQ